ncbi:MAG: methionine adenosyltransferase [Firmicutes bacterium]|nr:methionine adenosyltransferase [Bacillota bacterium]
MKTNEMSFVPAGNKKILTSESVNIGHPDKTCDVIADAFLDEALRQDPNAQMAVECAIKDDLLMIYGEATTTAKLDYEKIASGVLEEVGYKMPFRFIKQISQQSPDINRAVVQDELRANDQGIVYGYATNETAEFMPYPIVLAHRLMMRYEEFRKTRNDFFSDAKSQVSVVYENDKPKEVHTVLISVSHSQSLANEEIYKLIKDNVVMPILLEQRLGAFTKQLKISNTSIIINPSGRFTIWGSFGDSGCVGRKIVVDTYGGIGRVGGGCFSSKNATKVDRSGAYYARFVARNIVSLDLAERCEIQVSYGIGIKNPISINIETFGTNKVPHQQIQNYVDSNYDFSVGNIIKELDLLKPIYKQTAVYGHFGRSEFNWEKDKKIK